MSQMSILEYSSYHNNSPKPENPITVVPANKKAPPLEGVHLMKIGGMWTLKHDII